MKKKSLRLLTFLAILVSSFGAVTFFHYVFAESIDTTASNITTLTADLVSVVSGHPPGGVTVKWGLSSSDLSNSFTVPFCTLDPCTTTQTITGLTPDTTYHYGSYNSQSGTIYGSVHSFKTPKSAASIVASNITRTEADLEGQVSPDITQVGVKYGTTSGNLSNFETLAVTSSHTYTRHLSSLLAGTKYYYAVFDPQDGENFGDISSFTTVASSTALSVDHITAVTATFTGEVSEDISTLQIRLAKHSGDLTNSGQYSSITPAFNTADQGFHQFSEKANGLTPETLYYYASYNATTGDRYGDVQKFTTLAPGATIFATNITDTTADLNVTAYGISGVKIRYGVLDSTDTPMELNLSFSITTDFSQPQHLTGLLPNTTYYYAVYNPDTDVRYGQSETFVTHQLGNIQSHGGGMQTDNGYDYTVGVMDITQTKATLKGTMTTDHSQFNFFMSDAFGESSDFASFQALSAPLFSGTSYSLIIENLKPSTTYYFYAAPSQITSITGATTIHSFRTLDAGVTITSLVLEPTKATLTGTVTDGVKPLRIVWGRDYSAFTNQNDLTLLSNNTFTYVFNGLTPDTNYYYTITDHLFPPQAQQDTSQLGIVSFTVYYPVTVFHTPSNAVYIPLGASESTSTIAINQNGLNGSGIVPCRNIVDANGVTTEPCQFPELIKLIQNVMNFLLFDLAIPLAALVFAYAGFLYITSAGGEKKGKAKSIFWKVFIGFIIALSAWLIVRFVMVTLGYDTSIFPIFYQ